ncbi:MAG TPA: hypothetical protein VN749_02485, partial [Candidatus Eisenbacteria bacterium]|nr:hypothetical protein [Candidatus Eisenbacteria bacterium]
ICQAKSGPGQTLCAGPGHRREYRISSQIPRSRLETHANSTYFSIRPCNERSILLSFVMQIIGKHLKEAA